MALATFRISSLIADEDGPFGLFDWLRGMAGVRRDDKGKTYGTNKFAVGLTCLWCNSIWVGVAWTLAYLWSRDVAIWACFPLALSTVALTIGEATDWLKDSKMLAALQLARWNDG